jgi:hypothetical protein
MSDDLDFVLELTELSEKHYGMDGSNEVYPDEDVQRSRALRAEIHTLATAQEVTFSGTETRDTSRDDRRSPHYADGGYDVIHTLIEVARFASAAGLGAFLTKAGALLLQWRKLSNGRLIRIKTKDYDISVHDADDLDKAVKAVNKLRKKK